MSSEVIRGNADPNLYLKEVPRILQTTSKKCSPSGKRRGLRKNAMGGSYRDKCKEKPSPQGAGTVGDKNITGRSWLRTYSSRLGHRMCSLVGETILWNSESKAGEKEKIRTFTILESA